VAETTYLQSLVPQEDIGVIPKGTEVHKLMVRFIPGSSVPAYNTFFVWRESAGNWRYQEGRD